MSILIFSETHDNSTNHIVAYFNQFNIPYVRINTNLNYDNINSINIQNDKIEIKFSVNNQTYSIHDFNLIWARRGFFNFRTPNLKSKFKAGINTKLFVAQSTLIQAI